ncbi:hypothetical protein M441DRAFT_432888 [Trichoderma asperellum CBS 433.97]|uniref:Uncharacterized protein n=1 Tax=Trichoderma asperellum (strain ATCC 204424 / CBS 433.97 / NBRC 101777) TaxID=1042311 RepID=A0A2T3Z2S5_TRIA4|nr:hypothetical protein M441DRAFT_432888 [Trichoderma asperellum CBS 433.97]PTB39116.1 hypothetical protein M441DRAFT_432888 [Trichoderma asperellum CBS 433.97]
MYIKTYRHGDNKGWLCELGRWSGYTLSHSHTHTHIHKHTHISDPWLSNVEHVFLSSFLFNLFFFFKNWREIFIEAFLSKQGILTYGHDWS